MATLTKRQQQILDFLQKWQQAHGTMPSSQEITAHFGFRSPNAVTGHLRLMRKKGVIAREPGKARSLRITSPLTTLRRLVVDIPIFGSIPAGVPQSREQETTSPNRGNVFAWDAHSPVAKWQHRAHTL